MTKRDANCNRCPPTLRSKGAPSLWRGFWRGLSGLYGPSLVPKRRTEFWSWSLGGALRWSTLRGTRSSWRGGSVTCHLRKQYFPHLWPILWTGPVPPQTDICLEKANAWGTFYSQLLLSKPDVSAHMNGDWGHSGYLSHDVFQGIYTKKKSGRPL